METIQQYKAKLTYAFGLMRKAGLVARQNFACCGSCGSYELHKIVKEMHADARANVKGVAFYHRQDTFHMRQKSFEGLYIGYGQEGSEDELAANIEVGQTIAMCLRDAGLTVDWDGDTTKRIFAGRS